MAHLLRIHGGEGDAEKYDKGNETAHYYLLLKAIWRYCISQSLLIIKKGVRVG